MNVNCDCERVKTSQRGRPGVGLSLTSIFDKAHRHQNPGGLHFCRFGNYPSAKLLALYFISKDELKSIPVFPPSKYSVMLKWDPLSKIAFHYYKSQT